MAAVGDKVQVKGTQIFGTVESIAGDVVLVRSPDGNPYERAQDELDVLDEDGQKVAPKKSGKAAKTVAEE